MANFDSEFFSLVFSRVSGHPKIHAQNSRPELSALLSNFTFLNPKFIHGDFPLTGETNKRDTSGQKKSRSGTPAEYCFEHCFGRENSLSSATDSESSRLQNPDPPGFPLLCGEKKSKGNPEKARVFLFAEPLGKKGKRKKKTRKIGKGKKQGKNKQGLEGQGCFESTVSEERTH